LYFSTPFPLPQQYGRWIFEKYDGVRAFWNPEKKAFYSRLGNRFDVFPHDVLASMPDDVFLDGELWYIYPVWVLCIHFFLLMLPTSKGSEETPFMRRLG